MEDGIRQHLQEQVALFVAERTTVKKLYGDGWKELTAGQKSKIGLQFSKLVEDGEFPGLVKVPDNEQINQRNHHEYRRGI